MTPWASQLLADLCAERAGFRAPDDDLASARLGPLARREGFHSVEDLLRAIRDRDDSRLGWRAVEALAPAPVDFFGEPAMLDHLCDAVLPALAERRPDRRVRLWAAGCGGGQEVHSLVMALEERPRRLDLEIVATDLSEARLEKAQGGAYTASEVQRGLSARRLVTCFERRDGVFLLSPRLRGKVGWRRVNLMDDLSCLGRFDVILCRGVLPAFEAAAASRVTDALAEALRPDGLMVLSGRERAPDARWMVLPGPAGLFAPRRPVRLAA